MSENINTFLINIKKKLFGEHYRLVIWIEQLPTKQIRLEVVYINDEFERNNNALGLYYVCNADDESIEQYLIHLKNKYKIYELIETNYKLEKSSVIKKFMITKTDKLLFQENEEQHFYSILSIPEV